MHNSERRADWEYDKHPTHSHNVQNQSISANSSAATATLPLKIQRRRAAVTTWLKGRRAQLREGHASYLQELLRVGLSEVAPEHPHGSAWWRWHRWRRAVAGGGACSRLLCSLPLSSPPRRWSASSMWAEINQGLAYQKYIGPYGLHRR
jgi:hypothetical protein